MKFVGLAAILAALTAPAIGHWALGDQAGPFDGSLSHTVSADTDGTGFRLECQGRDEVVAVFIAPETVQPGSVEQIRAATPDLLIQVDDHRHFELKTRVARTETGALAVTGALPRDLIGQLQKASGSVVSGLKLLGIVYYKTEFSGPAARAATNALVTSCGPMDGRA